MSNYKWLVQPAGPPHCPHCAALNGQVRSYEEWVATGLPRSRNTFCGPRCRCRLEFTQEEAVGEAREEGAENGSERASSSASGRADEVERDDSHERSSEHSKDRGRSMPPRRRSQRRATGGRPQQME